MLALIVSEILTFEIFDFEKLGQGHGILLSYMSFDGKYRNLQKAYHIFVLALTKNKILAFEIFYLSKVGQDHRVLHSQ